MEMIERYTRAARWFHWLIAIVFFEMALSGLLIFLPWVPSGTIGMWTRLIHRIGAVFLVGAPAIFMLFAWQRSWDFIKEAFTWGKEDLEWLRAAPGYYFGGDPRMMPPQGYINTGMKLYRISIILGGGVFLITGFIMTFLRGIVPPAVFQWCLVLHDVTFIVAIGMFLLHFQLGVFHPRMDESLLSMFDGKVSGVYAKSHHGKWYDGVNNRDDDNSSE
ncbi:MAG: cytochrome b/b6 domain-containing protein [Dehalococcoidales bacterium]|nr:MAG: cytochrome b/b6 domain-containing protein [Dehalococcoidales bacterium]